MTNNKTVILHERIGIDQIRLNRIIVNAIDFEKVQLARTMYGKNVNYRINEYDGTIVFDYICIENDPAFSHFEYIRECINRRSACNLTICVNSTGEEGNLNNMTAEETIASFRRAIYSLYVNYGIRISLTNAHVCSIEINNNIVLDDSFKSFLPLLEHIVYHIKRFGKSYTLLKEQTSDGKLIINGISKTQKQKELKFYNKTNALTKKKHILLDHTVLRIELTLEGNSIRNHFKQKLDIDNLTQDSIETVYKSLVLDQILEIITDIPNYEQKVVKEMIPEFSTNCHWISKLPIIIGKKHLDKDRPVLLTDRMLKEYIYDHRQTHKNVPAKLKSLEKSLSNSGYNYLIYMQKHIDFLLAKIKCLTTNNEVADISISYIKKSR